MSNYERSTSVLKKMAVLGSYAYTATSIIESLLFDKNNGNTSSSKEGLQAHHSGKGRPDEALFKEALALAKKNLVTNGTMTQAQANTNGKKVTDIFGAQPVEVRKDLILDIGIGEQVVTEYIPQDSKGKRIPDKRVETTLNRRGIIICEDLLTMTPNQIKSWIHSTVNGDECMTSRLRQLETPARRYVKAMQKKHGDLPPRKSLEELRAENGTNPFSTLWKSRPWRKK